MLDLTNEEYLGQHGYRIKTKNTLMSYSKEILIETIRCLENNWAGEIWRTTLLGKRLENACNYIKKQDVPLEKINKIISVEGENI